MAKKKLIGPFAQVLTMQGLPLTGHIPDERLDVHINAGVLIDGERIISVDKWDELVNLNDVEKFVLSEPCVLLPGFIDVHTHICHAGSRARDYAMRMAGATYLEIANLGGGILDTVRHTREATQEELSRLLWQKCDRQLRHGVTTCEVKSGYGLTVVDELKQLQAIKDIHQTHEIDLVATCLAAHTLPPEFKEHKTYLDFVTRELLPKIKCDRLAGRVDIFVEKSAFTPDLARNYLMTAKAMGFAVVVHADQFTKGGSQVACEVGALSADHLEVSGDAELVALTGHNVVAVVLPGSTLGLGLPFAPARKMLDHGLCVVLSSDYNPGSAPMGNLLAQVSLLGVSQKLSTAEVLAGITCRAAHALRLDDRGVLAEGLLADMVAFACDDYREILYQQGGLLPKQVWKRGVCVRHKA